MARRLLIGVLSLLVLLPTACTWDRSEPGLFRSRDPRPALSSPVHSLPETTNPDLPVAGDTVWTTGDGTDIAVRIAVHAVRRAEGATVLDWSVTPLQAPGARLGDRLPGTADLGLTDGSGTNVGIVLVDPAAHQAYRPLRHASRRLFNHCLCTPVWRVQQILRIGETNLMQVAYPPLPPATAYVDVAFATLAPFVHVPVTTVGQLPTARQPTDLARPAVARPAAAAAAVHFRYPGRPVRRLSIQIDRIVVGGGLTSVEWTITSLDNQSRSSRSSYGPPVASRVPAGVDVANANPASGLTLRPSGSTGPVAAASWMTADIFGHVGYECLCTELGLWAKALWSTEGTARVVTNYPALPPGTDRVDVNLPGVSTLTALPVEPAPDAAAALGPATPGDVGWWTYPSDVPPQAWRTSDWPTGLPDPAQLADYEGRTETVGPLPHA